MQIDQILVRPAENAVVIQFSDNVGRTTTIVHPSPDSGTVESLIADCRAQLPAETDHPAKSEIEQEIAELEYRLEQLKRSIGAET
jgi:hypothetical protein